MTKTIWFYILILASVFRGLRVQIVRAKLHKNSHITRENDTCHPHMLLVIRVSNSGVITAIPLFRYKLKRHQFLSKLMWHARLKMLWYSDIKTGKIPEMYDQGEHYVYGTNHTSQPETCASSVGYIARLGKLQIRLFVFKPAFYVSMYN